MSTSWTQTAQEIYTGALELCEAISDGEIPGASDVALCKRALDGILKELPLHGLSWFKLTTTDVSITWAVLTAQTVTPPSDYFGSPVLKRDGVPLRQITKAEFDAKAASSATLPIEFYETPSGTFKLWPTPSTDPALTLSYQAICNDVTSTATPDIKQAWILGFTYWLADEISMKFGVPQPVRAEIKQRAEEKRNLMKQWAAEQAPIAFTVDNT